jgi:hypothetical protein
VARAQTRKSTQPSGFEITSECKKCDHVLVEPLIFLRQNIQNEPRLVGRDFGASGCDLRTVVLSTRTGIVVVDPGMRCLAP